MLIFLCLYTYQQDMASEFKPSSLWGCWHPARSAGPGQTSPRTCVTQQHSLSSSLRFTFGWWGSLSHRRSLCSHCPHHERPTCSWRRSGFEGDGGRRRRGCEGGCGKNKAIFRLHFLHFLTLANIGLAAKSKVIVMNLTLWLLTTTSTRLATVSINAQIHLRWVFGSTAHLPEKKSGVWPIKLWLCMI